MRRSAFALSLLAGAAVALAGCSAPAPEPADDDGGPLSVVASTNVYGSIAEAVGGDYLDVTSIITSSAQDPHSYEASGQDVLAVSHADLVIENGGGYDPFVAALIDASRNDAAIVVSAVEVSGLLDEDEHAEEDRGGGDSHVEGFNEHVWYSFEAMDALAAELARQFGELDPAHVQAYEEGYDAFAAGIAELTARAHGLREQWDGTGAAVTESVPIHLLVELGLENLTPDEFTEAIEEGADVPPLVLQETRELIEGGDAALLAYNEQTAGPQTDQLLIAAEAAGVPVVSLTETLPVGEDYLSWMADNIAAIEAALT